MGYNWHKKIMKKYIIVLTILLTATYANAQITLLHTFNSAVFGSGNRLYNLDGLYIQSPYLFSVNVERVANITTISLYNPDDFSLYKTVNIQAIGTPIHVSKNILTTDNQVCFILLDPNGGFYVYNEDAQSLATLNGNYLEYYEVNNQYYLITSDGSSTWIYSVPGTGEATDVETSSVPQRSARKMLKQDQVLIESNDKTYTIQGQEVR